MSLKELKRLKEEKLLFSVVGDVPTEEQITSRVSDLTSKAVRKADALATCYGSAAAISGMMAFYGFLLRPSVIQSTQAGTQPIDLGNWALHWMPYFVVTLLLMTLCAIYARYLGEFAVERDDLEPIAQSRCLAALNACEATEEGRAYRKQVIAKNRQFVVAELHMLTQWASGVELRANCAKLYSLADQESTQ